VVNLHLVTSHLVIAAFVGLNLLYVAFACPFDLSPDEAHYWDWSRRPDYCYYSKGPLVALLIRGSCELFGHTAFAVRLPAVLCGGVLLLGLHRLTLRATADSRLSLGVVLVAMTLPPVAAGSVLMTIDPPFLACWVWASVLLVPLSPGGRVGYKAAALLVAVGTLAKLTMLLFPACVLGWRLATRQPLTRRHLGFVAVSALGLVPIVIWNATHDWIGVRHLLGHGGSGQPWAGPLGVLTFLGGQLGLLLGVWFVFWVLAMRRVPADARTAFLWWLSAPVFAVFLLVSLRTSGQPNWPLPAYLTGTVLTAMWVRQRWGVWFVRWSLTWAVVVGLAFGVVLRYPNLVRPLLARLVPAPTDDRPAPVRQLDPTARLLGWNHLAARVDAVRDRVTAETGEEPLLAGMTWVIPGELGFYCRGNPTVYSFGTALADRASQYDVWRPNPVADAQEFAGRTFVYVGEAIPDAAFRQVELAEAVVARDDGNIPVANWKIWVCRGFRGFPSASDRGHPTRY
jgi:4-amino-4-deoxy-L-arabinose transferase-like glycosyltransferase